MIVSLRLVLLVIAFVLFLLAALNVPSSKVNLMAAGLACWVLTFLIVR